jgi:hypothetical protein
VSNEKKPETTFFYRRLEAGEKFAACLLRYLGVLWSGDVEM